MTTMKRTTMKRTTKRTTKTTPKKRTQSSRDLTSVPSLTVVQLLARARAQSGHKVIYGLGGGDIKPTTSNPWGDDNRLDCSAYTNWSFGLSKYQPTLAFLDPVSGRWYNTGGVWWDAKMEKTGHFEEIMTPLPGCAVVYPSRAIVGLLKKAGSPRVLIDAVASCPSVGHIGIVTEVIPGRVGTSGIAKVIHCSSGNYKKTGDAVQETGPEVFQRPGAILVWCSTVTMDGTRNVRPVTKRSDA
jgi:hypothetical protein